MSLGMYVFSDYGLHPPRPKAPQSRNFKLYLEDSYTYKLLIDPMKVVIAILAESHDPHCRALLDPFKEPYLRTL